MLNAFDRLFPQQRYTKDQISSYFCPNGKLPIRDDWKQLAAGEFREYRLKISAMVENPVELSLDDLSALGEEDTITMHFCISGWNGIAQWNCVPLRRLIEYLRPKPGAGTIVFHSFGPAPLGGHYYDTRSLYNALKPECMLAYGMSGQPCLPRMELRSGCRWKISLGSKW